jgi:hypothetical protein
MLPVYVKLIDEGYSTTVVVQLTKGKPMAMSKKDDGKAGTAKGKTVRSGTTQAKKKPAKKG